MSRTLAIDIASTASVHLTVPDIAEQLGISEERAEMILRASVAAKLREIHTQATMSADFYLPAEEKLGDIPRSLRIFQVFTRLVTYSRRPSPETSDDLLSAVSLISQDDIDWLKKRLRIGE